MSTLHTVNKSPFATQALVSCLNHAKAGDTVLMIEDGVYGGLGGCGKGGQAPLRVGTGAPHIRIRNCLEGGR